MNFVKIKRFGTDDYRPLDANNINLDYLAHFLCIEILYSGPDNYYTPMLKNISDETKIVGDSLMGIEKKNNLAYIWAEDSDKIVRYYFHTTPEKLLAIINRWKDIARTVWQLPDGTEINLPEEIMITEENGEVTITRTDGFDPYLVKEAKRVAALNCMC